MSIDDSQIETSMLFASQELLRQQDSGMVELLLEDSDSLTDFYELFGDEVVKLCRTISDGLLRDGIRDKLILATAVCAGFTSGGIAQFITEQPTAMVNGVEVEKFTEGMNIKEEFLEGGLPVVAGILLGEAVYKIGVSRGWEPSQSVRSHMWVMCGSMGYLGMYLLGDVLHQMLGVPDIKLLSP